MNEDSSYSVCNGIKFNVRKGDLTMTEVERLDIKARTLLVTVKSLTMVNENLVKANKELSQKISDLTKRLELYREDNCILADYIESLEKEVDRLRNEILKDSVEYNELLNYATELEKTANKYYELKNKINNLYGKYADDGR